MEEHVKMLQDALEKDMDFYAELYSVAVTFRRLADNSNNENALKTATELEANCERFKRDMIERYTRTLFK